MIQKLQWGVVVGLLVLGAGLLVGGVFGVGVGWEGGKDGGEAAVSGLTAHQSSCKSTDCLTVSFFDVGQGDATFIETPDEVQVLIDGGPGSAVLRPLGQHLSYFDRTIDFIIATHYDSDHISGLIDVLDRYEVKTILITENVGDETVDQEFFKRVENEVAESGAVVHFARAGQVYALGASTTLTVLYPETNPTGQNANESSIIAQLSYGEIDFLLTGDAVAKNEQWLVNSYGTALQSEILKLGHHGSNTSSSNIFLETVAPRYGVVSAGIDNSYGHPHHEVVLRATRHNIDLYSTQFGDVTFETDGSEVWVVE